MRDLRTPAIALLVAAATAAPATAASARQPLIAISGRTVALDVDSTQATERVTVRTASGVRTKDLRVRVARARRAGSRRADYTAAFTVSLVPRDARPDALLLTIDTRRLGRPGTYAIAIRASTGRGGRVTEVPLTVVIRPARLTVPAAIQIDRTRNVFGGTETYGAPALRNRSRHTWIPRLDATVIEGPTQDGKPADGHVTFATTTYRPAATRTLKVEDTNLPVGTATGVVELDAPQLDQPIRVPFTIVTKRQDLWIIVLILIGLILGTFTRTVLGYVIRLSTARSAARGLDRRLALEIQEENDPKLVDALKHARTQVELRGTGPRRIAAATDRAAQEREDAYKAFQDHYDEVQAGVAALGADVAQRGNVVDVNVALERAKQELLDATHALEERKVTDARQRLGDATATLSSGAGEAARDWATAAAAMVHALAASPLTEDVADREDRARTVLQALQAVGPGTAAAGAAGARAAAVVRSADDALRGADEFVGTMLAGIRGRARTERQRLAAIGTPEATAQIPRITEALTPLRDDASESAASANALCDGIAGLEDLLVELKATYRSAPTPTDLSRRTAAEEGEPAEPGAAAGAIVVTRASAAAAQAVAAPPAPAEHERFEAPTFLGLAALFVAGLLRFLILALVVSLVGYYVFRDGFVGTTEQMVNIAVWAFFTNVTVGWAQDFAGPRLPGLPAAATSSSGSATS